MQPKITSVAARTVGVPLEVPIGFSTRQVTHRYYGLVKVEVSDGTVGHGFCYEGSQPSALVAAAVRRLLAPLVQGQDPHRTGGLWSAMTQESLLQGRAGAVMRAVSAVDIALWDRNARAAGLPLWRYLGGSAGETVPAYASGGYYRADGDPVEHVAAEVAGHVAAGFDAVKIKVGGAPLAVDVARVAAARDVLGDSGLLMLDANNAWRSGPEALRWARAFEPHAPYFLEEPFPPDDVRNHQQLAARTTIPIATGELEPGRGRAREIVGQPGIDILQYDAAVCGGITEYRRIAGAAAVAGKEMWPHWFHDLHVHLVASNDDRGMVEFFPDASVLNFRALLDTQLETTGGEIVLPDRPGLGFGFDPTALDRHALDGWA